MDQRRIVSMKGIERYEKWTTIALRAGYIAFAIWAYDSPLPFKDFVLASVIYWLGSAFLIGIPATFQDLIVNAKIRKTIATCLAMIAIPAWITEAAMKRLGYPREDQISALYYILIIGIALSCIVIKRHAELERRQQKAATPLPLDDHLALDEPAVDQSLNDRDSLLDRA